MDKKKLGYLIHHCAPLVRFSHRVTTEQLWFKYGWGDDKLVFSDDEDVDDDDEDDDEDEDDIYYGEVYVTKGIIINSNFSRFLLLNFLWF